MYRMAFLVLATAVVAGSASAQTCPAAVPFGADDSLARLAARCGVSPSGILSANDAADEAALRQMGAVAIPRQGEADGDLLDRTQDLATDAAGAALDAADTAGEAVSGYLDNHDIVPDDPGTAGQIAASAGPELAVAARPGGAVRVVGAGLPGSRSVTLYLSGDDERQELTRLTTERNGTFSAEVDVPEAAFDGETVLTLETTGGKVRLSSDPLPQR